MMSSPDDVILDMNKPPSTSSASSSLFDAPGLSSNNKQPVVSDRSTSEQYNERGIDVGFENSKIDECWVIFLFFFFRKKLFVIINIYLMNTKKVIF